MWESFLTFLPYLLTLLHLAVTIVAGSHVILHKSEVRGAIGWIGIIVLTPLVGSLLYFTFGINRVQRRARLRRPASEWPREPFVFPEKDRLMVSDQLPGEVHLCDLAALMAEVTGRRLMAGNSIQLLDGGDQAYPAMLAAIGRAERSVSLSSYIFDNDPTGLMFVQALREAVRRGVEVRVLVDAVGSRYSRPTIASALRKAGVPVALFMPTRYPWRFQYANLRHHRKILVVDGRIGFTGGMNIRQLCCSSAAARHAVRDVQFRLEGPVVGHLQDVFALDWAFTTDQSLDGDAWFPALEEVDSPERVLARGVSAGPDHDLEKIRLSYLGAIGCARRSIRIVTPYFVPDESTIAALNVAAMRGVSVDVIVPQRNNLRLVQWASRAQMWQILEHGCRIWESAPPFDHSKLMVVDDAWTFVGSANWDARSLRLNFEFNVECYGRSFSGRVLEVIEAKRQRARRVTWDAVMGRSLPVKIRDGVAWLASPYL